MGRILQRYLNFLKNQITKDEVGFGIIEVMVATSIIVIALSVLAYTTNLALIDVAYARQRQSATSLADKAIEQIKALPYATVAAGLYTPDLSGDPAITSPSPGAYYYGGESIPNFSSSTTPPAPLYPHVSPPVLLQGTSYTTHVYITNYNNNINSGIYRATAVVSWTNPVRHGSSTVKVQTLIFSPQGCLSGSTHPYSAPCEAFFYASGTNGSPGSSLSGSIYGLGTLNSASLSFPQIQSNLQAQQISSVKSDATGSGSNYGSISQGSQTASAYSSTDPTSNSSPYVSNSWSPTSPSPTGPPSGSWGSLSLASTTDTGQAIATTSDSTVNSCSDLGGILQHRHLPCGDSNVTQGSGPISASLNLTPGGLSIGNIILESLGSSSTSLFEAQYNNSWTSTTNCSSTSGDGCVHSSVKSTIGSFYLGGVPSPGAIPSSDFPSGWGGNLVSISGFSTQVNSESGVSAASPSVSSTGSISYWNGTGYSSLTSLPTSSTVLNIPTVTINDSDFNGQSLSITLTPNLTIGPNTTTSSGTSCAAPNPCTAQAASSILSGSINYVITQGSTTLANFNLNINLGSLVAKTTYQAAPNG